MAKILILLAIIAMLAPSVSAEAGWEEILSPDGYVDTALQGVGMNQTSDDVIGGGGGNPISGISDPVISLINDSLGTNWGFLIFYTFTALIMSIFLMPLVGGFILSYLAYIAGTIYNFQFTFILMIVAFIIGAFLFYKITRKSERLQRLRKVLLMLLILFIIVVILLFSANVLGVSIPGFNAV